MDRNLAQHSPKGLKQQRGSTKGEVGGLQQHEGDEKPGAPFFDVWMITSLQLLCQGSAVSLVNKSSKEINCAGSLHH